MAETQQERQIKLKVVGIYVIIILVLLRFLIYPLHVALEEKKVLLKERYETYRLKSQVQERHQRGQAEKVAFGKEAILPYLYEKGTSHSLIQAELLDQMIKLAEQKRLSVLSFEMLNPAIGKGIIEVPVTVRIKGPPMAFIETLETIEKSEKLLSIRSMDMMKSGQDYTFSLTLSAFRLEK